MSVDLVTPWAVEHACMRHDELIENASRLRESFRQPLAAPSSRRAREKAGEKLSRLVDDLVELLRIKREVGYFQGMSPDRVRLQTEVDQLNSDWEQLVSDLTALAEHFKRNRANRSAPSRLQKCFRSLGKIDLRESRIVQDLWSFEIGSTPHS